MMRRKLLGVTFLFCGLVIASLYNYSVETYVFKKDYTAHDKFCVSGYFQKENKLFFNLVPNDNWAYYSDWLIDPRYINLTDYVEISIQIEINNTNGEKTVLDIIYILYTTPTGEVDYLYPFAVIMNSTTGGLRNVKKSIEVGIIEGIVETEGNYSARLLTDLLYEMNLPPKTISLLCYQKTLKYEYRHLAPFGFILIIIGVITLVYIYRTSGRKKMKRRVIFSRASGKLQNVHFQSPRV
ncbi:MAG: hypothetical protein QXR45_07490 [Candidatus Bathyarchaeia archaeon]